MSARNSKGSEGPGILLVRARGGRLRGILSFLWPVLAFGAVAFCNEGHEFWVSLGASPRPGPRGGQGDPRDYTIRGLLQGVIGGGEHQRGCSGAWRAGRLRAQRHRLCVQPGHNLARSGARRTDSDFPGKPPRGRTRNFFISFFGGGGGGGSAAGRGAGRSRGPSEAAAQRRGRAMRKRLASGLEAGLEALLARPRRAAGARGAATRAHSHQVGPGRRRAVPGSAWSGASRFHGPAPPG